MAVEKRSLKQEKLARIYDDQIAPVWGSRFGKMLLRNLAIPERGQILDISCGTGYPLVEVLRKKADATRIIAIDASSAMLDIARKKVADLGPLGKKGVFFRTESPVPRLSFADGVYDLVLCNLGLNEMPNAATALSDFARVTKIGGEVRCTLPLTGTWGEFHDIYREVLVKHDRHDALDRLDAHLASYPTIEACTAWLRAAGLEPRVEVEEFTLLFKSSREFFFAPVVEFGPLPAWKAIAGAGQELQDVFWHIKESIDAYFGERAFQVAVTAGCLVGRKLDPALAIAADDDGPILLTTPAPARLADGSVRDAGTAEVDILEIQEVEGSQSGVDYHDLALDAFTDGKSRPRYLHYPEGLSTNPGRGGGTPLSDPSHRSTGTPMGPPPDTRDIPASFDDDEFDAGGLVASEEDASEAPTSDALTDGHERWDAADLGIDDAAAVDDDAVSAVDDDADTGDHVAVIRDRD